MSRHVKFSDTIGSAPANRYGLLGSLTAVMLVAGCSSVPDAVNPVEWYRSTVDAMSDDNTEAGEDAATAEEGVPGEGDEFPNLASVPERPTQNVQEGLIADPNAPRYANSIQLQGDDDGTGVPVTVAPEAATVPSEPGETQSVEMASAPEPAAAPEPASVPEASTTAASSTETVRPPTRTNTPPLVIQPGRLPSGETYEEYRARLMKGLDTTGTSAMRPTTGYASTIGSTDDLGTVVVSSNGVDQGYNTGNAGFSVNSTGMSEAGFRRISRDGQLVGANSRKVATIRFKNGSDSLDGTDVYILRQVAALYEQNGGVIRVIGHASSRTRNMDPVRHKLVNYRMSSERADAVASALVRLGLPKDAIVVGAASDSEPVYREVMPTGEAGNRRAEIYIDS